MGERGFGPAPGGMGTGAHLTRRMPSKETR